MNTKVKQTTWLAITTIGKSWNETPQEKIEDKNWREAVAIAKKTSFENGGMTVRLSESPGYNNQGHYFTQLSFSEVTIRFLGTQWLIVDTDGEVVETDETLQNAESLIEICNMWCFKVINKQALREEYRNKLMY